MDKSVLILGARGRLGLAAAKAFATAGWQVHAHMRPGAAVPSEAQNDARIQWVACDYRDVAALTAAAPSARVVVHAMNPAYTQRAWQEEVLPMADAALAVSAALNATLMLPGNVYNFGSQMPAVLNETTPQRADTVKGQVRVALEQKLAASGVRCVVLRAGDFFGGGKGTWFDQAIVKELPKGVFSYPGSLETHTAWAYLPDLARTFVLVAERREQLAAFEVFHFAGHSVSARRWLEVLQPIAEHRAWVAPKGGLKVKTLPWGLMRWLAWAVPSWASLLEMKYLWDRPYALGEEKLLRLLGSVPHTPLPLAAETALADLGMLGTAQRAQKALDVTS